jgi:hypothetical protein
MAREFSRKFKFRRAIIWIYAVIGFGAAAFILWKVPQWQVSSFAESDKGIRAKDLFAMEDDARKTIAQILGGAFVLAGLYFTARTYLLNYEGQITDRFSKAVGQLGHESIAVRLGGIYALERIAKDSTKDSWTILEVVTAYIRSNSSWKGGPEFVEQGPPTDIEAALAVIGRNNIWSSHRESYLDLIGVDLRRAYIANANLDGANFADAHLEGADLRLTSLNHSDFRGAFLGPALEGWNGADLEYASLICADFTNANLLKANLSSTNLTNANFTNANLERTDLRHARGLTTKQLRSAANHEKAIRTRD